MSPSPTVILQMTANVNQNNASSIKYMEDLDEKYLIAAGEERARMRYRMNTHPRGI